MENNTPLTPEELAKQAYPDFSIDGVDNRYVLTKKRKAWAKGYESAQSRIAELEYDLEKEKLVISSAHDVWELVDKQRIEKIAELEIENGKLRGAVTMASNSIEHRGKLNKTLMGLLEKEVKKNIPEEIPKEKYDLIFKFYCKEHNLNPPTKREQS